MVASCTLKMYKTKITVLLKSIGPVHSFTDRLVFKRELFLHFFVKWCVFFYKHFFAAMRVAQICRL